MTFEYDITTTTGKVRLLIGDTLDSGHLFEDEEIAVFLALGGDDVRLAAAQALETMAANQVMVLKVMTMNGTSTNGAAVAAELRNQAKQLREQAGGESADGLFDWVELATDPFSARERLHHQALRGLA